MPRNEGRVSYQGQFITGYIHFYLLGFKLGHKIATNYFFNQRHTSEH